MTDDAPNACTSAVQASFDTASDARARDLLRALVRHLHEFVQETQLSTDEWRASIDFLTDAGHRCTDNPLAGAALDVWKCTSDGFYDVQQPGDQPAGNGRGLFTADDVGCYWFRTVVPGHYPIPTLRRVAGRHP